MAREYRLRVNLIQPRANMAGGVKSGRLIAEALARRGHEVNIVYPTKRRAWPKPWRVRRFARRLANDSRLWWEVRIRGRQRHHLEQSSANLLPVKGEVVRAEDVPDADVSIANFWRVREWMEDWSESKGIKALYIRGHFATPETAQRISATYRMGGLNIVHATWLKRLLAEQFDDPNGVLVPNGVDWSQFDSEPRRMSKVPRIGFMYDSSPRKGAKTILEAIRIGQRRIPSLEVVSFGSVPIARHHRRPQNFKFFFLPAQELIPKLYRQTDCWVVPSRAEGLPMPGLEAAACRCPVVATRCGGPEDYVEQGANGYLVPVGDPEAMADAILKVLTLDETRWKAMSEASYRIAKRFDWNRSAEILEDALLKAVREREGQKGDCEAVGASRCRR